MNSLPLISHHLFVAAISSEDRGRERPTRRARACAEADISSPAIIPEVIGRGRAIAEDAAEIVHGSLSQVQT
jgi:hypothetical protein